MKNFKSFLKEYNKTSGISADIPDENLREYLKDSIQLKTHINTTYQCLIYRHDFNSSTHCIYILKDKLSEDIIGYVTMVKIKDNIWQTLELTIFPKYQNQGFATSLYAQLTAIDNRKLINGDSLSKNAEKLWAALIRDKRCKHIYDKKLNKIYSLSDIGTETSDNIKIADPTDDNGDIDNIRFFYLTEIHETFRFGEQCANKRESDIYECWLKNEPYIFEETEKSLTRGTVWIADKSLLGDI